MRSRHVAVCLGLALTGILSGCANPRTQLVVVVDTDIPIPSPLDLVEVTVRGPSGMMETERQMVADRSMMPLTLGVEPAGDVLGPITVTAIGRHTGTILVLREHVVTLVRGETRMLVMHLAAECVATMCADGETCSERGCIDEEIDAAMLPAWTGTAPSLRDAGPAPDARPLDAGDVGPVDGGGSDAGGPCGTALECDDANPCTDDACAPSGCTHTPNAVACDDGLFCNGLDTCSAGTCAVHAGNPCGGPTTCSEATGGRCEGCTSDADCPAPVYGAYGACSFSDLCAISGTHARTVQTFSCVASACVPSETSESESCSRGSTDGTTCSSRTCAAPGACGGFSDECDESGEASQTCFEGVCSAGSCTTVPSTVTVGCSRSTGGSPCGPAGGCGGWSSCGFPSECATSGTHDRTCQDRGTCGGGVCNVPAPRNETEGCSRSTDGAPCNGGGEVCSGWGACSYSDPCALGGSRSQTCQPQVCTGGSCGLGGARTVTDTSGCGRATDGVFCDDGNWCTVDDSCYSGICYSGWDQCACPFC